MGSFYIKFMDLSDINVQSDCITSIALTAVTLAVVPIRHAVSVQIPHRTTEHVTTGTIANFSLRQASRDVETRANAGVQTVFTLHTEIHNQAYRVYKYKGKFDLGDEGLTLKKIDLHFLCVTVLF